jgi:hypothetical protein
MRPIRLVLTAAFAALCCYAAAAQTPVAGDQRIIHEFWTFKNGALEAARAFAQTADGYLWVGALTLRAASGSAARKTNSQCLTEIG